MLDREKAEILRYARPRSEGSINSRNEDAAWMWVVTKPQEVLEKLYDLGVLEKGEGYLTPCYWVKPTPLPPHQHEWRRSSFRWEGDSLNITWVCKTCPHTKDETIDAEPPPL